MREALKYLQAGAIVPVDMETTILLVNALKEALAQPEQRKWVGLTDEVKHDCYLRIDIWSRCVEMVEAKLKEKNCG